MGRFQSWLRACTSSAGYLEKSLQRLVEESVDGVLEQDGLVYHGAGVGVCLPLTVDLTGDLDHFHAH